MTVAMQTHIRDIGPLANRADGPIERGLQILTVLSAVGSAWQVAVKGTAVDAWLAIRIGFDPAPGLCVGLLLVAALLAARPRPSIMRALSAWFALVAVATTVTGAAFAHELTVPAHAARISLPLVWAMWRTAPGGRRSIDPLALARVAIAMTFVAHGAEALLGHPGFVAYIVGVGQTWHLWQVDGSQALQALVVIGVIDVVVGLAICLWPSRAVRGVAVYMAVWGAVTALARVLYADLGALYEVFIRSAHFGLPLLIAVHSPAFTRRASAGRASRRSVAARPDPVPSVAVSHID